MRTTTPCTRAQCVNGSVKAAWYSTIPHDNPFPHSCVGFGAPLESCLVGCNRLVLVPNKPRQMVSRMHGPSCEHSLNLISISFFLSRVFLCLCFYRCPRQCVRIYMNETFFWGLKTPAETGVFWMLCLLSKKHPVGSLK